MQKLVLIDVIVFIGLLMLGNIYPWLVKGTIWNNPMIWAFIVTIPVSIYFGLRKKKNWKKIFTGSIVFGLLLGSILEYVAHVTGAWQVPTTIFPFRILGGSTIEALIGYIPMTFFVLVFYEHFFDKDINHRISPRIWYAIIPPLIVWTLIIYFYYTDSQRLFFSHAYLKMGIAAIIPAIFQVIKRPRLFSKYAKLSVSLFFVFFVFEVIGITFDYWVYKASDYIGLVTINGKTFPLEEIIFWMFFYPATIAAYYEGLIDDDK